MKFNKEIKDEEITRMICPRCEREVPVESKDGRNYMMYHKNCKVGHKCPKKVV